MVQLRSVEKASQGKICMFAVFHYYPALPSELGGYVLSLEKWENSVDIELMSFINFL